MSDRPFLRRFRHRRWLALAPASAVAATLLVACDDELVDDATFRLWCGDSLCAWQLESGRIRPAPTWHEKDHGVELVDANTVISQDLKRSVRCIEFTTVADVEPAAQVTVGLDFNGDGVTDYEQPVVAVGFREVKTLVTAPRSHTTARISIAKRGTGRAVLAQMRLRTVGNCSAPPLRLQDQPLGAACTIGEPGAPSECASGVCCEGVCAECCVDPGWLDMGPDGGVVTPPHVSCQSGSICARRTDRQAPNFFASVPLQCDPGRGLRPSGSECLAHDDCASNTCEGAHYTVTPIDPAGPEASCSSTFPDAGEACSFVRVQGGRCR